MARPEPSEYAPYYEKYVSLVLSVCAIAYNIAGHELHHMKIVRTRYLSTGGA